MKLHLPKVLLTAVIAGAGLVHAADYEGTFNSTGNLTLNDNGHVTSVSTSTAFFDKNGVSKTVEYMGETGSFKKEYYRPKINVHTAGSWELTVTLTHEPVADEDIFSVYIDSITYGLFSFNSGGDDQGKVRNVDVSLIGHNVQDGETTAETIVNATVVELTTSITNAYTFTAESTPFATFDADNNYTDSFTLKVEPPSSGDSDGSFAGLENINFTVRTLIKSGADVTWANGENTTWGGESWTTTAGTLGELENQTAGTATFAGDAGSSYTVGVDTTAIAGGLKMDSGSYAFVGSEGGTLNVTNGMTIAEGSGVSFNLATTLGGKVENKGTLHFGDTLSVAEGTEAILTGSGTTSISGTVVNDGKLTIDSNIVVTGDLVTDYLSKGEFSEYQLVDGETASVNTDGNGFFGSSTGGSFWLTQSNEGKAGTTILSSDAATQAYYKAIYNGKEYALSAEDGHCYFTTADETWGNVYNITTGDVIVNSKVQAAATGGYALKGGVMQVTEGTVDADDIAYTSGSINLASTASKLLIGSADATKYLTSTTGTGVIELSTYARLKAGDATQLTGKLVIVNGGDLRLGEEGDDGASNSTPTVSTLNVELNGGKLTTRGFQGSLNSVTVSSVTEGQSYAELYIADTTAADNVPASFTIGELAVNADLNLKTNWKSCLIVNWLTGSEDINFVGHQFDGAGHHLRVNSVDGYTGVITMQNHSGNMGFLTLNIKEGESLNASQIKACANSSVVIGGTGTYNLGSQTYIAASGSSEKGSLSSAWTGTVVLEGATLTDADLNAYGNTNSAVELKGVTGSLQEGTISTNVVISNPNNKAGLEVTAAGKESETTPGTTEAKTIVFAGKVTSANPEADEDNRDNLVVQTGSAVADTYKFTNDVSGWNGNFIVATDAAANVEYADASDTAATVINNGIIANGGKVETTIAGDKAVIYNGEITNNKWGTKGTLNLTVNNTSTEGVTFTNSVKADATTIAAGSKATFNGTESSMGTLTLEAGASVIGTANLTITELVLDLGAYTTDYSKEYILVSTTGMLDFKGSLDAYQNVAVGGYTANVTFADNSLTLNFTPEQVLNSLTTTVSGVEGFFNSEKNMLTLNIAEGDSLADVGSVTISGISDDIMKQILGLEGLPEGGMVGITLLDEAGNEFTGGVTGDLVFQGNTGVYEGEVSVGSATQYNVAYIPEPTTATLSLLALAGLAARRRRK